jgi:SAM-dependent methyltransferase
MADQNVARIERAASLVGYANGSRYRMPGEFLFEGIPLTGAHLLDVGCGAGAWAIWAALYGAQRALGIEPESHGSHPDTLGTFRKAIDVLQLGGHVQGLGLPLQELPTPERPFDIVMMYNVINHLDEDSVVSLHADEMAFRRYVDLLRYVRSQIAPEGWVIVADCGRTNFWDLMGLRSPMAPTIEWRKHQNPAVWAKVFEAAGFRTIDVRWSPVYPFSRLTANRVAQYLTASHFVLRVRAPEGAAT